MSSDKTESLPISAEASAATPAKKEEADFVVRRHDGPTGWQMLIAKRRAFTTAALQQQNSPQENDSENP